MNIFICKKCEKVSDSTEQPEKCACGNTEFEKAYEEADETGVESKSSCSGCSGGSCCGS